MIYDVVIRGMMPVSNIIINASGELRFVTGSIDINSLAGSEFDSHTPVHVCAYMCGGQRTKSSVLPSMTFFGDKETGFLIGLKLT